MDRTFEQMVELGVYTPEQVNEDGEIEYSCDLQKAKEHAPEIYLAEMEAIDKAILDAVDLGYLEIDMQIDPEGNLSISYIPTEKC